MNSPATVTSDIQKTAPVYLVTNGEIMLESPVKDSWRHIVNYPSWQNYTCTEHISGSPGQEGEVILLKKEEEGFTFPPFYARTIKLEPEQRVMWKTFSLPGAQDMEFFGIVDFKVYDADGKTRFSYASVYEFMVPHRHESELTAFRDQQYANTEAMFKAVFPKLRKLTEKRG